MLFMLARGYAASVAQVPQPRPACAVFSRMSVRPRTVSSLACTLRAPLQTRFTAGGARGHRRVGREYTHTHTHTVSRSHIVLKKWRGRSGGGHSPTTERERRNNGDSEEEGLLRVGRG